MNKFICKTKPERCPLCRSERIAKLIYGYPNFRAKTGKDIKAERIILAGCCFAGDDPTWKCIDCDAEFIDAKRNLGNLKLPWLTTYEELQRYQTNLKNKKE